MEEDNITRQAEEIEALCSIYGDNWQTEDEHSRAYSICLSEAGDNVTLYVTLPADYPSLCPPVYQLSAPAFSRMEKQKLSGMLENVYIDNLGESVLFQWVECIKEFMQAKSTEACSVPLNESFEEDGNVKDVENLLASTSLTPSNIKDVPNITHGDTITDRKSIFQGHVASVTTIDQVKSVLSTLMENKKIANATHNIHAYRLRKGAGIVQDCEDDGETAAGGRLLHMLQIMDMMDVIVVVSRWYGGVHLGPDRFRHINNAARQVLEMSGLPMKKK